MYVSWLEFWIPHENNVPYIYLSSILQGHRNVTNLGEDKHRGRPKTTLAIGRGELSKIGQNCWRIVLKNCRNGGGGRVSKIRKKCQLGPLCSHSWIQHYFIVRSGCGHVSCCGHCLRLIRLGLITILTMVGTSPNVPILSNGPDLGIFLTVEIEQCKWHLCIYQSTYHLPMNVT